MNLKKSFSHPDGGLCPRVKTFGLVTTDGELPIHREQAEPRNLREVK